MKVTARIAYAILAVFELGLHPEETKVQAKEIAERQSIPPRFLEQILIQLKKAGLVRSIRGASGGYLLEKSSAKISLKDIMEAVEGEIVFFDPKVTADSSILNVWSEIEEDFLSKLQSITVRDLIKRKTRDDNVIVYHI